MSDPSPLCCCVLQGSFLGPNITSFALYLLPFEQIMNSFDIAYHLFADDIQLYFSYKPSGAFRLSGLFDLTRSCFFCLRNIRKLIFVVSTAELEMHVHVFMSPCLDYCNTLLFDGKRCPNPYSLLIL